MNKQKPMKIKMEYTISIIFLVFVVLAVISMIYFYQQVRAIDNDPHDAGEYQFHYVMISDSPKDAQWREIFAGGSQKGQELGAFVENWGVYLQQDFSLCEQLEMAIAANVDGIIIKGYDNERILTLIDQGVEVGIPIVTLLTDVPGSERSAFISLNDYALGRIFGQQLLEVSEQLVDYGQDTIKVTVLTQSVWDIGISGVIYRGIHETIGDVAVNIEINSLEIGAQGEFEAEERIRDLFLSERTRPDVLISLNATNTMIAFQSLIDYNLVGQIRILGTSDNDMILDGIYQGIIHSSVFIDERNMGAQAISLLHSNVVVGYSSDYVTFNVELINLGNLYRFVYRAAE